MIGGRKFRTEQARRRERVRVALRSSLFVLAFILLGAGFVYGIHRPALRIAHVYVTTGGSLDPDMVSASVLSSLEGSRLLFIPKNSSVFLSTDTLEASLREQYPRIKDVSVRRGGTQAVSIAIAERDPAALWCGDVVPPVAYTYGVQAEDEQEEVWGECYLVDGGAYVYARAPVYTGNVFPRYYGSLSRAEPVDQHMTDPEEFSRWQGLFTSFKDEGRELKALLFVDERDVELYITGGLRVLVLRQEDPSLVVRRLAAALSSLSPEGGVIEYVDMRFGNKVYVKRVGEESAPAPAPAPAPETVAEEPTPAPQSATSTE
jgi:cell division septal protein FtsQ